MKSSTFLVVFTIFFLGTLPVQAGELLCLFNKYRGSVYQGNGASFRVRICTSQNCSGWSQWDWLQFSKNRIYEYPRGGYLEIQWNADGDNSVQSKRVTVYYTLDNRGCEEVNSWSFYAIQNNPNIGLFPGKL